MRHRAAAFGGAEVRGGDENGPISRRKSPSNGGPECRYDASRPRCQARNSGQLNWKNIFEVPVLPKSTLRLLAAKAPVGSLDIDPTGLLRACGAHARRVWAAEQPATPCSTCVSSHGAKAAMLLVVKIDVSALAATKMRILGSD